jgi:hypothetical protein
LQDFELFGSGWTRNQIRLHETLQTRQLREGQGLISRKEIAKDQWIANWNVEIKATEEYEDMEMESLDVRVKFMGSAEYDPEVDTQPTSGIVTVVSKAAPQERVTLPYPESCIPVCERRTEQNWDPDDPQCGPKPPFNPEWKIEHGTFNDALEDLHQVWSRSKSITGLTNTRSIQPENAAVLGKLDVANQRHHEGREDGEPLNLHDPLVLEQSFGAINGGRGFAIGFENHAIQNAVAVVVEGGEVTQGGDPFTVEVGDIIQIVDFTKLDDRGKLTGLESPFGTLDSPQDGAFLHIQMDDIVEESRTSYLQNGATRKPNPERLVQGDIEMAKSLEAFSGGKLAVYVEKFSDTDGKRTRDGDYFIQFRLDICKVETPASILNPDCMPVPAYECGCRPLRGAVTPGLDLTFAGNYLDVMWYLDELGEGFVTEDFRMEVIDRSDGISLSEPSAPALSHQEYDNDCHAKFGQFVTATDWQIRKNTFAPNFGREVSSSYTFAHKVSVIVEHVEVRLIDCIGKIDTVVLGRSAVHAASYVSDELTQDGRLVGEIGYLTEDAARAAMERAIGRAKNLAVQAGYAYLCNRGRFTNDQMTHGDLRLTQLLVRDWDGDGDVDQSDVDRAGLFAVREIALAASYHEWSLQKNITCSNAITFTFPGSEAEIDAQRDGRHYFNDSLGPVIGDPLFYLNYASFPNKKSTCLTTAAQAPIL